MAEFPSRTRVSPLVIGLLCVVGIAMGAATLDSAQSYGTDDGSTIELPGGGEINAPQPNQNPDTGSGSGEGVGEGSSFTLSTCNEFLASMPGTLAVLLGFVALVGGVYRRYNGSTALLVGWTMVPPVALVYFLVTNCGSTSQPGNGGIGGSGGLASSTPLSTVSVPPWALGAVLALALVGAVAVLYRTMGGDDVVVVEEEEAAGEDPDLDQFAAAAGRAADRIEEHNVDVDNAVYRAWVEMTQLLDVEKPETYAPGEFAEEAVRIGMNEDDVSELTRLFNEVRYGDKDAGAREDRAVAVLRNIESEYGVDETEDILDEDTATENGDEANSTDDTADDDEVSEE